MIRTRFTEVTGVEHPITCGGMGGIGKRELVSAVADAGALGFLTALTFPTPEALAEEIALCRDLTDRPFGVNVTILPTMRPVSYEDYFQAALDAGVRLFETAGRSPEAYLPMLKAAGAKVIHKVTSVRHAVKAESLGVDVVSIDGFECAGHPGEDDIGGLVLTPVTTARIKVPVITSGGIADGRGLAAALALGAEGVNMGTRFVATQEAPLHDNVKQQIVRNGELDTNLILRKFSNTARVARNTISNQVVEIEAREGTTFEDVAPLVAGQRTRERVLVGGDIEDGMWWASQAQGLIHDIPTCRELVDRTIREATEIIARRLSALVS